MNNIHETLKTIFPDKTKVHIYKSPKPLEKCFDLDEAYEEFRQMGFNTFLAESTNGEKSGDGEDEKARANMDYILIVGDYSRQEKTKTSDILIHMNDRLNKKPIEIKSDEIESAFDMMGMDLGAMKPVKQNKINHEPELYGVIMENRKTFTQTHQEA